MLALAFGLMIACPSEAATLNSIQLTAGSDAGAQLTLDLSGTVKPRIFSLEGPRLVIDLPNTKWAGKLPEAIGPVTAIRSGAQPKQTLRLVLHLSKALPTQNKTSSLAKGRQRLIVQLGTGAASPAKQPSALAAGPAESRSVPSVSAVATPEEMPPAGLALQPEHEPRGNERAVVVAIDAGHGGADPGAIGKRGTYEKIVVLGIATALAKRINAEPGMRAVLTRQDDRFVQLRDRIEIARNARADLFVSIHADAIANRDVSGSSVYVLSERGATSEAARWLAEQENAADLKGGVSLGDKSDQLASVLMDLSQTASIGSSLEAAGQVLAELDQVGTIRKTQVQQAGFIVLKSPDIPSMLIETAYISNLNEEKKLRTSAHQTELALAIFRGIRNHFRRSPPDGTLFARWQKPRERSGAAPSGGSVSASGG